MGRTAVAMALVSLSTLQPSSVPAETPTNAPPIRQHPDNPHYLDLPVGDYRAEWVNTRTGAVE